MRTLILSIMMLLCVPARAEYTVDPEWAKILAAGLGMSLGDYLLQVTIHEGSHAAIAAGSGASIKRFEITPSTHHGRLTFGYTEWEGDLSKDQVTATLLGPIAMDIAMMSIYTALLESDALPKNKYAQAAILLAMGIAPLVDYGNSFRNNLQDQGDIADALNMNDIERGSSERMAVQAAQGALMALFAVEMARGLYKLFRKDDLSVYDKWLGLADNRRKGFHPIISPTYFGFVWRW